MPNASYAKHGSAEDMAGAMAYPQPMATGTPMAPSSDDLEIAAPAKKVASAQVAGVKAGEWDDNANYRDFQGYIAKQGGIHKLDVSNRQFVVVEDKSGRGVPNCAVSIAGGQTRASLTTLSSGRAMLFPSALGFSGDSLEVSARCGTQTVTGKIDLREPDGLTRLKLDVDRVLPQKPVIEVAFILDTTGSMSEEIEGVKSTIDEVVKKFDQSVTVRVGLVEYKDQGDTFVTRAFQFTNDLAAFRNQIDGLTASGGGDTPEDVNAGIASALSELKWSKDASSRVAFLIADAPPHLDYPNTVQYPTSAKKAAASGIKVFTISASGMDDLGQATFRQIAQFTGGSNMFVLRGGAGPQSAGAGDAKSSCGDTHANFSSGNLHELIIHKVKLEVAALKADPLAIAGRGKDENAKPCNERVMLVAE